MAKQKKFDYFSAFEEQLDIAAEEADILIEAITNFTDAAGLEPILKRAHEVEHRGDEVNRAILSSVAVDFITPIEREDIIELASDLDDVTDKIEGTIQRFYMMDVHHMQPQALEFAEIIRKSLKALRKSMGPFREFKKAKKVQHMADDVNQLEEQADVLYINAIRELYTVHREVPMRVAVWTRLYERLEDACDSCKTVADTMATIMLKNV